MKSLDSLKRRARMLKGEVLAIALALKDKRTPWLAKVLIGITVSYALSPLDLIPDFIPVLGYLDDLILIPLLISLSLKMIPDQVMKDCRRKVEDGYSLSRKAGWFTAGFIILLWIALLAILLIKLLD